MENSQAKTTKSERERSTGILWALLPLLATFGGAWAVTDTAEPLLNPTLLTMLALILGGWVPLWFSITHTNWSYPLHLWQHWTALDALPNWPYLQEGSPGSALYHRLSQARAWWKSVGQPAFAVPLRQVVFGVIVSLILGFIIGRTALLLSLLYFVCTQLAVLWSAGRHEVGTGWLALTQAGLPWLLGTTLTQENQTQAVIAGAVMTVLVGLYTLTSPLAIAGPIAAAIFLIERGHTVTAGWMLLLSLPGFMKLGQRPKPADYRNATLPWILVMVGLITLVV